MRKSIETKEELQNVAAQIDQFQRAFNVLRTEVHKSFVGQETLVDDVLMSLFAGGHVLLEGVPGLGKTLLARTLASALQLSYERIQCTPDLMPADILGCMTFEETDHGTHKLVYRQGPVVAHFVLVDEINRATPKTQSALLEAMQEGQVTVGTRTISLPQPNIFIATQNPVEQEGVYPLPEAQLDRFLVKLKVHYPQTQEYRQIIQQTTGVQDPKIAAVLDGEKILTLRKTIRQVEITDPILDYAIRLVVASQPQNSTLDSVKSHVVLGASPRGVQALVRLAKVRALLNGRTSVSCRDIRESAYSALRHRIVLNFSALSAKVNQDTIIQALLEQVPAGAE